VIALLNIILLYYINIILLLFYIFCNGLKLCFVWECVWIYNYYVEVQQSLYRPLTGPEGFHEGEAPRFKENRIMKVVRLLALCAGRLYRLVLIYVRDWVYPRATGWPEGLCQWRIQMNTSGIELTTFRLLAQYFNQLRHRICLNIMYTYLIIGLGNEAAVLYIGAVICERLPTWEKSSSWIARRWRWRHLDPPKRRHHCTSRYGQHHWRILTSWILLPRRHC
jgi:hypothetical protein